jgi:hypothetical protein
MATGFLDCCAARWRPVVERMFVAAVAEGAASAGAVVAAVGQVAAEDLDHAMSHGEIVFYETLLVLLLHHHAAARQYAQELLEQQAHAA